MGNLETSSDWNVAKGLLKQKWSSLTDDDLGFADDK